jgi:hypothetical protein
VKLGVVLAACVLSLGARCTAPVAAPDAGAPPPPPDPEAQRLAQLVERATARFKCPDGTTQVGDEPPDGKEAWCEKDGKRHGPYHAWHDDGVKALEGSYAAGKRSGRWVEWYPNGQRKSEATYVDDKPQGRFRIWSEHGEVISDVAYDKGKVVR